MFIHQTITKSLFSLSQSVSWSYPSRRHTIHRLTEAKADFLHWYHHITVLLYSWYSYKDMWLVEAGSWPWTIWCTPSCILTTLYGPLASKSLASSPCSSPWRRSPRWWWAAWSTTWCIHGCSKAKSARPMCRTFCGRPSCTSATLCSSASSLRSLHHKTKSNAAKKSQ